MSVDLSQFIPTFLEESFEGLQLMESSLLELDAGDTETINAIFRAAHSIKGGAGTFGFSAICDFTHDLETLLDKMRNGTHPVTQNDVNLLLEAVDCIRLLLEAARDEAVCDAPQIEDVHQRIGQVLNGSAAASHVQDETAAEAGGDDHEAAAAAGWLIEFKPHPELLKSGNEPLFMFMALADLGALQVNADIGQLPMFEQLDPSELWLSWHIRLESGCSEQDVREIFEWVEDECDLNVTALSSDVPLQETPAALPPEPETGKDPVIPLPVTPAPVTVAAEETPAPASKPRAKARVAEASSIRVDTDKVDALIDRVGELVITQAMLGQVGEFLQEVPHEGVEQLQNGLAQLERNTRDLQEEVMRIRMMPISFVFNRFPRMVHDTSSKLGKQVELKLSGEQTELDKTVMEKIGDPLVHLVRNSLDHGLELPDERRAAGKPDTGLVHLNAFHQGGYLVIEISDDGRGLNSEKIRTKALEKGLISPDQNLTEQDIHDLIFMAGFSTADQVSDLSGRGVGMDVVRRNIESLGGQVGVRSTPGKGSTFSVSLPLTLAILDGQLVNLSGGTYIIPLVTIIETLQVATAQLKGMAGHKQLLHFRDDYIPLYPLAELFHLPPLQPLSDERMLVVVVEHGGERIGLLVDELLGQQQVVIKSLETNYKRVDGLAGATILGDGAVALILDIAGLVKLRQQQMRERKQEYELTTQAAHATEDARL